jgi:glycosyltransferase 2 family protein
MTLSMPKKKAKGKKSTKTNQKRKYIQKSDWYVLAGLAVFIIAALFTRPEEASALEEAIFLFFYVESGFLIPIFFAITQLGSVYFFAALSLLYLFMKNYVIVLRLLMAGSLAYLLSGVGKDLFGRGRPDEVFGNIEFHDMMVRGPGFPSGHTAMAVALGIVLYNHTPKKWHIPIIIMTFLAAISRMVLGVHTPLDIVGGAAIGWMSAMLFRHVKIRDRTP